MAGHSLVLTPRLFLANYKICLAICASYLPQSTIVPTSTNPATTNGIIILEKKAPREVQISHHEFDDLKQTTKDQIILVYD